MKAFLQQVVMLLFYILPPTARPRILHGHMRQISRAAPLIGKLLDSTWSLISTPRVFPF